MRLSLYDFLWTLVFIIYNEGRKVSGTTAFVLTEAVFIDSNRFRPGIFLSFFLLSSKLSVVTLINSFIPTAMRLFNPF